MAFLPPDAHARLQEQQSNPTLPNNNPLQSSPLQSNPLQSNPPQSSHSPNSKKTLKLKKIIPMIM